MKKIAVVLLALILGASLVMMSGCTDVTDNNGYDDNNPPVVNPNTGDEIVPETIYKEAYLEVVNELNTRYEGVEWTYGLVDVDGKDAPELVACYPATISLYTFADGKVYPVMEEQSYGITGHSEYMYLPGKNVIFTSDDEMAGAVVYETYCKIGEYHSLENYHNKPLYYTTWKDANGDGVPDDNEIGSETYYFFGNDELTKEQFDEYRFGEGYDLLYGEMSYDEIVAELTK